MMLIILVTIVKRIITHCLIMEIEINITLDISKASKEESFSVWWQAVQIT